MKIINFALIFVLVLLLALSAPGRTQTTAPVLLPPSLNTAMCVNDWEKALSILQTLLGSDTTTVESRQQLVALRSKIQEYRARRVQIDQSDACAAALIPVGRNESVSNRGSSDSSNHCTTDGRCFGNRSAKKRHERSLAEGDYSSPE